MRLITFDSNTQRHCCFLIPFLDWGTATSNWVSMPKPLKNTRKLSKVHPMQRCQLKSQVKKKSLTYARNRSIVLLRATIIFKCIKKPLKIIVN